jgi:thymidylate synthase (FAD)
VTQVPFANKTEGLQAAIKAAGSQRALARALGMSPQALMSWRRVPEDRLLQVEAVTGVPREQLWPELYRPSDLAMTESAGSDSNGATLVGQTAKKAEPVKSIPLLDHGYVRLVDHMGDDLAVVRAARTSFDAAWRAGEDEGSDTKLIRYLMRNGHSTPFEHVTMTFEVKAPIFVFRQWHRHRTQSYSELSARYRELPAEYYAPDPAVVGRQSTSNKQARVVEPVSAERITKLHTDWLCAEAAIDRCFEVYRYLLSAGWPRELARSVLPLATYSHMFVTANLLNWFRFLTLRHAPDAQWEIRQYAEAIVELIRPIAPVCVAAWEADRGEASRAQ